MRYFVVLLAALLAGACARMPHLRSGSSPKPVVEEPAPHVAVGALAGGLDAFIAAHPRGTTPVRIDAVGQTPSASYSLVQAASAEAPHRHRVHDLTVLVLRGDGVLTLDGERLALRAGDAVLVPRNHVHWFAPHENQSVVALAIYSPPLKKKDWVAARGVDSPPTRR